MKKQQWKIRRQMGAWLLEKRVRSKRVSLQTVLFLKIVKLLTVSLSTALSTVIASSLEWICRIKCCAKGRSSHKNKERMLPNHKSDHLYQFFAFASIPFFAYTLSMKRTHTLIGTLIGCLLVLAS